MSTSDSLAYRSIVLVGSKGAGKSTIANCLSETTHFPVGNVLARKSEWLNQASVVSSDNISFFFHMVESVPDEKSLLDTNLPNDVSLVIFVFRYNCFTNEEKKLFESVKGCFNEKLSEFSALVITGCDDLSEEAKEEYKKSLDDPEISKFSSSMKKGIYCVTLPDTEKLSAKNADIYGEDIKESHKQMQCLLANCKTTCSVKDLMIKPAQTAKSWVSNARDKCLIL